MSLERTLATSLVDGFDQAWQPLLERTATLTDAEFHWQPADDGWGVHERDGAWLADWTDPDPEPAPVTTIAWRTWHLAVDALDSYSARLFGRTGSGLRGREWVGTWSAAQPLLAAAGQVFREGLVAWGDDLFVPLGDSWGPFAQHSRVDLYLHARREVSHHGAEIALLRDLYAATTTAR
ncbi:MAG: DinB family protein [Actinomycetota bacterium]|nr:DinB family protein [Actinomycetota bacterium]